MAELDYSEKATIEKLIESRNGVGYVLDFSDQSFRQFVGDATKLDIDDEAYRVNGNSKAKRLRTFISLESDETVSNLISHLVEHRKAFGSISPELHSSCMQIVERLRGNSVIEEIYEIQPITDDKDFEKLARSIIRSSENGDPSEGLDRLHTYAVKFIRALCDKHNIQYSKNETLNSIFSKYVKYLRANKLLDSTMAEKILIYSFEIMSAFNSVRNDQTFAHDNPLLNHDEGVLITKNIANAVKFIRKIEEGNDIKNKPSKPEDDELPF